MHHTWGWLNVFQLVFGLTYPNILRFGICLIINTFRHGPLARVSIPSAQDIDSFKEVFAVQHSLLNDCWATIDSLKLYLHSAGNTDIQEHY
jgi:hypothetical protein